MLLCDLLTLLERTFSRRTPGNGIVLHGVMPSKIGLEPRNIRLGRSNDSQAELLFNEHLIAWSMCRLSIAILTRSR